jgi:hypothetical protein
MRLKNEHDLMKEIEHLHSVSRRLENERQELQIKFEQLTVTWKPFLIALRIFFWWWTVMPEFSRLIISY